MTPAPGGSSGPSTRRSAWSRPTSDELVDLVDADDLVVEVVTRAEARARGAAARHRACYVAVLTSDGDLVVHRRADWKDVYPGYWDVCFGGVLGAGEAWDDAAHRELLEEAGDRRAVGAPRSSQLGGPRRAAERTGVPRPLTGAEMTLTDD